MRKIWKVLLGIGALGLAVHMVKIVTGTDSVTAAPSRPYRGRLVLDMQTAPVEEAVKTRLRDPESARFGAMDLYDDRKLDGVEVTLVCGTVNSKNGFGGYGGPTQFMVETKPLPLVMLEGDKGFARMWDKLCAGTHRVTG